MDIQDLMCNTCSKRISCCEGYYLVYNNCNPYSEYSPYLTKKPTALEQISRLLRVIQLKSDEVVLNLSLVRGPSLYEDVVTRAFDIVGYVYDDGPNHGYREGTPALVNGKALDERVRLLILRDRHAIDGCRQTRLTPIQNWLRIRVPDSVPNVFLHYGRGDGL
jgi:hypothetical protein